MSQATFLLIFVLSMVGVASQALESGKASLEHSTHKIEQALKHAE